MVTYIQFGNIFKLHEVYNYAHGCNCAGAMGKGIALQFKERFPKMYIEYKKLCSEKKFILGDVFVYNYGAGYIFNLGTQSTWRTKADINAIGLSLNKMLQFASNNGINKIALPRIGAGLGGANWPDIVREIDRITKDYPKVHLLVIENYNEE